jgi:hypothetical protein
MSGPIHFRGLSNNSADATFPRTNPLRCLYLRRYFSVKTALQCHGLKNRRRPRFSGRVVGRREAGQGAGALIASRRNRGCHCSPKRCISPFAVDRNNGVPAQSYLALSQLAPAILEYQGTGKIFGWLLGGGTINNRATDEGTVGNYKVGVKAAAAPAPAAGGGRGGGGAGTSSGMIITLAPDEFYILQANSTITFTPSDPAKGKLSVDLLEEGKFVNDKWVGQPVVVQNRELTPSITTSYKNYHVKLSQKP